MSLIFSTCFLLVVLVEVTQIQAISLFKVEIHPFRPTVTPFFPIKSPWVFRKSSKPITQALESRRSSLLTYDSAEPSEGILFPDDQFLGWDATESNAAVQSNTPGGHNRMEIHPSLPTIPLVQVDSTYQTITAGNSDILKEYWTTSKTYVTENTNYFSPSKQSSNLSSFTEEPILVISEEQNTHSVLIPTAERSSPKNTVDHLFIPTTPEGLSEDINHSNSNTTMVSITTKGESSSVEYPEGNEKLTVVNNPETFETTTKSSKSVPVPVDGGRVIFDVPQKDCPQGTKRTARGQCRHVYRK